jgi:hypothetical protein
MTVRLLTVCLLGLSAIAASARPPAADISGTWAFTVHLPNGDFASTFVFKQAGEKLSGTYSGPLGPADVTGTVKGDQAVFGFTGKNNQGEPFTVDYIGKIVSAAKMTGTVDFHKGPPVEFTATKSATKK